MSQARRGQCPLSQRCRRMHFINSWTDSFSSESRRVRVTDSRSMSHLCRRRGVHVQGSSKRPCPCGGASRLQLRDDSLRWFTDNFDLTRLPHHDMHDRLCYITSGIWPSGRYVPAPAVVNPRCRWDRQTMNFMAYSVNSSFSLSVSRSDPAPVCTCAQRAAIEKSWRERCRRRCCRGAAVRRRKVCGSRWSHAPWSERTSDKRTPTERPRFMML